MSFSLKKLLQADREIWGNFGLQDKNNFYITEVWIIEGVFIWVE